MTFTSPNLCRGGLVADTPATSFRARHSGGVASLPPRDERRLRSGFTCLLGFPPPRIFCEFIVETAEHGYSVAEMLDVLDRFSGLSPEVLRAVGGDRFPPRPLRSVP